jgi:hypothetical protein
MPLDAASTARTISSATATDTDASVVNQIRRRRRRTTSGKERAHDESDLSRRNADRGHRGARSMTRASRAIGTSTWWRATSAHRLVREEI